MSINRRDVIRLSAAAAAGFGPGASTVARAGEALSGDSYDLGGTPVTVHPVTHASLVLSLPERIIYVDPVGPVSRYRGLPTPDLVLITHEHSDHFDAAALQGLVTDATRLVTNPAVFALLPAALKNRAQALANGDSTKIGALGIAALPAYNTTKGRLQYHPKGRDNGYLLTLAKARIYIAGDTEETPEMRALKAVDIAFLPMNLPYTMEIAAAAAAVAAFRPKWVYPYHCRGSDIAGFARLVAGNGSGTKVVLANWYPG